jgi:hypothetical protein
MKPRQGATTGAALALALLAVVTGTGLHAGEATDKAVKAIEKLGGTVTRDDKATGKPIVGVDLDRTQVTDAGLKMLAGLKQLQKLNLDHTRVTDTGLKELAGLKHLEVLVLSGTKVTDAGLKEWPGSSTWRR